MPIIQLACTIAVMACGLAIVVTATIQVCLSMVDRHRLQRTQMLDIVHANNRSKWPPDDTQIPPPSEFVIERRMEMENKRKQKLASHSGDDCPKCGEQAKIARCEIVDGKNEFTLECACGFSWMRPVEDQAAKT